MRIRLALDHDVYEGLKRAARAEKRTMARQLAVMLGGAFAAPRGKAALAKNQDPGLGLWRSHHRFAEACAVANIDLGEWLTDFLSYTLGQFEKGNFDALGVWPINGRPSRALQARLDRLEGQWKREDEADRNLKRGTAACEPAH